MRPGASYLFGLPSTRPSFNTHSSRSGSVQRILSAAPAPGLSHSADFLWGRAPPIECSSLTLALSCGPSGAMDLPQSATTSSNVAIFRVRGFRRRCPGIYQHCVLRQFGQKRQLPHGASLAAPKMFRSNRSERQRRLGQPAAVPSPCHTDFRVSSMTCASTALANPPTNTPPPQRLMFTMSFLEFNR